VCTCTVGQVYFLANSVNTSIVDDLRVIDVKFVRISPGSGIYTALFHGQLVVLWSVLKLEAYLCFCFSSCKTLYSTSCTLMSKVSEANTEIAFM
jgi:hypothetical protein